jgi:hypothetical protein
MAWKPTNTIQASYNSLPDGMIPINSKPVIGHILDDLLERWLNYALILLNKNDIYTEKYIRVRYINKFSKITFVYIQDNTKWILWSIYKWLNNCELKWINWLFIYLWDTIYKW